LSTVLWAMISVDTSDSDLSLFSRACSRYCLPFPLLQSFGSIFCCSLAPTLGYVGPEYRDTRPQRASILERTRGQGVTCQPSGPTSLSLCVGPTTRRPPGRWCDGSGGRGADKATALQPCCGHHQRGEAGLPALSPAHRPPLSARPSATDCALARGLVLPCLCPPQSNHPCGPNPTRSQGQGMLIARHSLSPQVKW